MVLTALLKESASALWANRLRSFLTVLGMVMGVTSVIVIVAAVEGMQYGIESAFHSMGSNVFIATRFGMVMSYSDYADRMKRKKLTRGLIPIVEQGCPDCDQVGAEGYARDNLKYETHRMRRVEIRGETPNMMEIRNFDIVTGRYMSWEDDERRKQVAFIGYEVYEKFFEGIDPLGKKIRIGGREFTVIGVAEKMDQALVSGMDNFVVIPLATLQKIYKQPGSPVNLIISSKSLEQREAAMDQVRVVLRSLRRVPYGDADDFELLTPDAILSFINDITRAFRVLLISMPVVSIVIGGIVIMNIMMVSVTERTREIGIRKSIGARRRNILLQFMYESLLLSGVGGVIGIALGLYLGRVVLEGLLDVHTTPTALGIILGFTISSGVGLFFGIYPAMKAARLDPIKALSYE